MKIATTEQFRQLNEIADERSYNRVLNDEFMDTLDPEGIHVCSLSLYHEHKAGKLCEPHLRTVWHVKQTGSMKPIQVQLDCDMELFNKLSDREIVTSHD